MWIHPGRKRPASRQEAAHGCFRSIVIALRDQVEIDIRCQLMQHRHHPGRQPRLPGCGTACLQYDLRRTKGRRGCAHTSS